MINMQDTEGNMISKKLRELTSENMKDVNGFYEKHLNGTGIKELGIAKSVSNELLIENHYSFVPGRYVGFVEEEINKEELKIEIKQAKKELELLMDEFQEMIPNVKKAIEKALEK